jgi:hypothetical protein
MYRNDKRESQMIYSMLEIDIRDAVDKSENLNENFTINWNFVDADVYAANISYWKDDTQFYEAFDEIAETIVRERTEEANAERQLSLNIGE